MNVEYAIICLTERQRHDIEDRLDAYDREHTGFRPQGSISIGIQRDGRVIAGLDACMTTFKIMYVSTVFVDLEYRRQGYGRVLMEEMEKRAKELGANTVRLDTFNWQGKEFYDALGYEQVGHYVNAIDGYEECFFKKSI